VNGEPAGRRWVCELYVSAPEMGGWRSGSGTLLPGGLVLTAAHIGTVGAEVVVRPLDGDEHGGTVVWSGADCDIDVALVRMQQPVTGRGAPPEPRWGRLVCDRVGARVHAVGFPLARTSRDGVRETDQLVGTVRPMGLAKEELLDIAVESPPKERLTSEPSAWSGMSGAGLFCGDGSNDVLVGVVVQDDLPAYASRRVRAVPVSAFADRPEFAELVWPGGEQERPGLEPAELAGLQQLVEPPSSPASLLRADAAVVPFHGRDDLLHRLHEWCEGPPWSAWLITGPGGQGKTRLARRFAAQLRRQGWATVVLATITDPTAVGWLSSVREPLLLVIDYAEQRSDELKSLGQALVARGRSHPDARLRVLFLARSAGEWRWLLPDGWDFADAGIAEHTDELPPLDDSPEDRQRAFGNAVSAFASRLRHLPGFEERGGWTWADRANAVSSPVFRSSSTALDVQLAALVALLRNGERAPPGDPTAEALYLLNRHEAKYWERVAKEHAVDVHPRNRRAAVAAACLLPAVNDEQALAILARLPGLKGLDNDRLTAVAFWLRDLYPSPSQFWAGLQPDLLAEDFVFEVLKEQDGLLASLLAQVDDRQANQALTVLARSAARHPHLRLRVIDVISLYPDVLAPAAVRVALEVTDYHGLANALDRVVGEHSGQLELLRAIYRAIPYPTQVHARLAVTVAGDLVTALQPAGSQPWDAGTPAEPWTEGGLTAAHDLARALNELSVRHRAVGRYREALREVDEAVAIWERLVTVDSPLLLADLAASLNNKANCLDELDRRAEALTARHDAVDAYRRSTGSVPEVLGPDDELSRFADLATALSNLSTDLDGAESLDAARESVQICRRLAAVDETFTADLARSLNSLSRSLSGSGDFREALRAASEAVELYEPLAEVRPDAHLPGLAASYNNMTRCLVELGQTREALDASTEAVRLYRQLARSHPDTYRPDLARAYWNRSDRRAELGRLDGALLDIREVIKLYRSLAKEDPDIFRADLVRCLRTCADRLREAGRPDLAAESDAEAERWSGPEHLDDESAQ
jgi:tetratricopeptide (TPR) repeat protein